LFREARVNDAKDLSAADLPTLLSGRPDGLQASTAKGLITVTTSTDVQSTSPGMADYVRRQ
jgi:hypothetical protein